MKKRSVAKNLDDKIYVNFFDTKKYRAIIYNTNGEQVGTINLDRTKDKFNFKSGKYNVDWKNKTYFKRSNFFSSFKYFHYVQGCPDPLVMSGRNFKTPKFNADKYNQILETRVVRELNNVNKNFLQDLLTPKNLLIGLAVIGIAYYFLSGGTIS